MEIGEMEEEMDMMGTMARTVAGVIETVIQLKDAMGVNAHIL